MYSFKNNSSFNDLMLNFNSAKNIDFYHKFLKKETVYDILNFNEKILKNKSSNVNIYFEKNMNNFLEGYSDFSALALVDVISTATTKGINNIDSNFCLIDESFLIIQDQDINSDYDIEKTLTCYYNKSDYENINTINESLSEYNENQAFKVNVFLNNYISNVNIYLSELLHNPKNYLKTKQSIKPSLIPQFSSLEDATNNIVEVITHSGDFGLTFDKLGLYLTEHGKNKVAYTKYGENHSKLAELIDLVVITNNTPRKVYLTKLGEVFYSLDERNKVKLLTYQMLRMDIIRDVINKSKCETFDLSKYLENFLAKSTATRRMSSIKSILRFLKGNHVCLPEQLQKAL